MPVVADGLNFFLSINSIYFLSLVFLFQQLPSRIYVEMIAVVMATYVLKGSFHVEYIQNVYKCTGASSIELLVVHSCMCSVVRVYIA